MDSLCGSPYGSAGLFETKIKPPCQGAYISYYDFKKKSENFLAYQIYKQEEELTKQPKSVPVINHKRRRTVSP